MDSPVFILSTGRTGTQFFESYFNATSNEVVCRHEPRPSRRFKFYSNMFLQDRIHETRIARAYLRGRKKLYSTLEGRKYIESSNFIFGCIPALNTVFDDIAVVHIVRHPVAYVKSHLGHGFWKGHKKFFARHVPYWLEEIPRDTPPDPVRLLAERWNYVNRQVATYRSTNRYIQVKFEELFSEDIETASKTVNAIREFCGIKPLNMVENEAWLRRPKNISHRKTELGTDAVEAILRITGPVMEQFNYTSDL